MFDVMPVYLAAAIQSTEPDESLVKMVLEAELVIQLVLLILIVMSIACWAIIVNKRRLLKRATSARASLTDGASKKPAH